MIDDNHKPIPRSILIFGAAAHVGEPLAHFLHNEAPEITLRLVSSSEDRACRLRHAFPDAEVVTANYFEIDSLERAVRDMEGIFVITPGGLDEGLAMTNLVAAVRKANTAIHIQRTLGIQPEANPRRIPQSIRDAGLGLPIQHPIAKRVLDDSGLPVTYLNFGATFMDNLLWMKHGLASERKLIWHNRLIPFIDPRDIAEVAGRLFLSNNHRHIGQFHTLNNGHDLMRFSDVANLMSDVLGESITFDGTKEAFFAAYAHMGGTRHALWDFFEYERANEVVWALNDFVERTLGRQPRVLRSWLEENATALLS
ncbi:MULTISPECIES: NAD(P)H-binding protein [unclassified Mycolicibacterium]|nr:MULTISPECIES: NAD(P)H-binding protein [unclassified Mycolicibacterium]